METVTNSVAKTDRVVCVEEGWPTYGVTAAIAARIQACFDDLDARSGASVWPRSPCRTPRTSRARHGPTRDKILNAALGTLG